MEGLDCCPTPKLEAVRTLYRSSHDSESLMQCAACGTYWFSRFHESVDWAHGDDEITCWYTKLKEDEALTILETDDRRRLDLGFLAARQSIREDANGVRVVKGQPERPFQ